VNIQEITDYVMGLSVEDVRRLTATEIMGWHITALEHYKTESGFVRSSNSWRPDEDRNQSQLLKDKLDDVEEFRLSLISLGLGIQYHCVATPNQESRAILIAHYVNKEHPIRVIHMTPVLIATAEAAADAAPDGPPFILNAVLDDVAYITEKGPWPTDPRHPGIAEFDSIEEATAYIKERFPNKHVGIKCAAKARAYEDVIRPKNPTQEPKHDSN